MYQFISTFFKLISVIFLATTSVNGQEKYGIELPPSSSRSGNIPQDIGKILDIYVTEDHGVYIQDERIRFWDEVVTSVLRINRQWRVEQIFLSHVMFRCDKNVKYRIVDQVKERVARIEKKFFLYKVGSANDSFCEADIVHGTIEEKWLHEPIKSKASKFDSIYPTKIYMPDWLKNQKPLKNEELRYDFRRYLYSGNIEKVKSILSKYKSISITLLPDEKYSLNGEIRDMANLDVLRNFVVSGQILFYRFDPELTYEGYINFLESSKQVFTKTGQDRENFGILVEVSFGLEKKLKEWKLDIFDDSMP